jgi:hypothetical protein
VFKIPEMIFISISEDPSGEDAPLEIIYHHLRKHEWESLSILKNEFKREFPKYKDVLSRDRSEYRNVIGNSSSAEDYVQFLN